MKTEKAPYGRLADGRTVDLYTLKNKAGMTAKVTNYGGIIVSLLVPDRNGKMDDVVLGCDSLDGYLKGTPYFGCITGRYANRISTARFTLDNREYRLADNNNGNCLHGGKVGFDKVLWKGRVVETGEGEALELKYRSTDMEEGFPGNLDVTVTYAITDKNELTLEYRAVTDKTTVLNLTNHTYFNLLGCTSEKGITDHVLTLNAARFTPSGTGLIPTGEVLPVAGTPLDFTKPAVIGSRIESNDPHITGAGGYDHNFIIDRKGEALSLAARLSEPVTGRLMETYTTEPAIQFYTGNFLDGRISGKGGIVYFKRKACCLETQHYPDSPNKPNFPSTRLEPDQQFVSLTVYKFTTIK